MIFRLAVLGISFLTSLLLTPAAGAVASRFGVVDRPGTLARKRHKNAVPLFGGVAIFASFVVVVSVLQYLRLLPHGLFPWRSLVGVFVGGAILTIGGILDDVYDLAPCWQMFATCLAVAAAVAFGVTIESIRSPAGGLVPLDFLNLPFSLLGRTFKIILPGDLLAFLWLLGLTYTTKFLDGLDGLVAGLTVIAAALIFGVALRPELNQPGVALLAAAAAGVFGGFLVWNFNPARIFLGQSGSTFAGFLIGSLAVISGSKVATTLLVLGVPIVDVALVIVGRFRDRRRVTSGDLSHLHFRLLGLGFSERKVVLIYYSAAVIFGSVGLFANTAAKAGAFLVLAALLVLLSRLTRRSAATNL